MLKNEYEEKIQHLEKEVKIYVDLLENYKANSNLDSATNEKIKLLKEKLYEINNENSILNNVCKNVQDKLFEYGTGGVREVLFSEQPG